MTSEVVSSELAGVASFSKEAEPDDPSPSSGQVDTGLNVSQVPKDSKPDTELLSNSIDASLPVPGPKVAVMKCIGETSESSRADSHKGGPDKRLSVHENILASTTARIEKIYKTDLTR
ncbi:MAG: hypothetical protein JKY56_11155 [Kofleriaceae bacterium]|nr:hypothetical protein [Kofleriaceae bacterium]